MFATLQSAKPLILRGAQVKSIGKDGVAVTGHSSSYSGSSSSSSDSGSDSGSGCGEDEQEETSTRHRALMIHVLDNCSKIVDVRRAQCGVEADRGREMKAIEDEAADQGGLPFVNKSLEAAITRGMISVQEGIMEVDNFLCGEPEGLRKLPVERVEGAVFTVCAAGLVEVLDELLDARDAQQQEEEEEEEEEIGGREVEDMAAKEERWGRRFNVLYRTTSTHCTSLRLTAIPASWSDCCGWRAWT